MIDETNMKEHVYPTYPRNFLSFKWYKPIFTGLIFYALYMLFMVGLLIAGGVASSMMTGSGQDFLQYLSTGYDDMNVSDWQGVLLNLGTIALMIPALALAALIMRDRPFSSYSSARGGWDRRVFRKCFGVAFVTVFIPICVREVFVLGTYKDFEIKFTIFSFVLLTILGPLQCIAEEYIFRGLLMQTLGAWVRIPVIAIVLQAAVFASQHPYNMIGVISIVISGLTFGCAAWLARGIEASAAIHVANNMACFYLVGFNLSRITSEITIEETVFDAVMQLAYLACIFWLGRKHHWFDRIRKDDVTPWNQRVEEKRARKLERKQAKHGKHTKA